MTRRDRDTLAEAIATFEAFSDLRFTEAKIVIEDPTGAKVNATLSPDVLQKLWRTMTSAAVKHIETQMAEYEAKGATMN